MRNIDSVAISFDVSFVLKGAGIGVSWLYVSSYLIEYIADLLNIEQTNALSIAIGAIVTITHGKDR